MSAASLPSTDEFHPVKESQVPTTWLKITSKGSSTSEDGYNGFAVVLSNEEHLSRASYAAVVVDYISGQVRSMIKPLGTHKKEWISSVKNLIDYPSLSKGYRSFNITLTSVDGQIKASTIEGDIFIVPYQGTDVTHVTVSETRDVGGLRNVTIDISN